MVVVMEPEIASLDQRDSQALALDQKLLRRAVIRRMVFMQAEGHQPLLVIKVGNGQGVAQRGYGIVRDGLVVLDDDLVVVMVS